MWPFSQREKRSTDSYTDLLIDFAVQRATGTTTPAVGAVGALQAAAGLVSRCFAAATVEGPANRIASLTPGTLSRIGRALIRSGEIVMVVDVDPGGAVRLHPASSWDVQGSVDPASWVYRCSLPGPSETIVRTVDAAAVVHPRFETTPSEPWKGLSPVQSASLAGRLSAELSSALGDEASMPRGALLALPVDGEDPTVATLKADLKALAGKLALVESTQTMHPGAASTAPKDDWQPHRIGAAPGAPLVALHTRAGHEIAAVCGVPPSLLDIEGDGTRAREDYRRFLHACLLPLAAIVQAELRAKLEAEITINLDPLMAADLQGKARAWRALAGADAQMDAMMAARLVGLAEGD